MSMFAAGISLAIAFWYLSDREYIWAVIALGVFAINIVNAIRGR